MLRSIRLGNLRSLEETGVIELRPLTILVGRNSSGKSTLLRVFPLLRQSIEARTTGPILWYGSYVDYGSYSQAHHNGSEPAPIELTFDLIIHEDITRPPWRRYQTFSEPTAVSLTLRLGEGKQSSRTYVQEYRIEVLKDEATITLSEQGRIKSLSINKTQIATSDLNSQHTRTVNFIPLLTENPFLRSHFHIFRLSPSKGKFANKLLDKLTAELDFLFHQSSGDDTKRDIALRLTLGNNTEILDQLKKMPQSAGKFFHKHVKKLTPSDERLSSIRIALFGFLLPDLVNQLDDHLAETSKHVRYIAPIRATAERYYRSQDLAVDEIDFRGTNMSMFLQSLSESEREDFAGWCAKHLSFSVSAESEGGHLWIELSEEKDTEKHNLADMGFGFSQVLPIAAQLWSLLRQDSKQEQTRTFFALEQPELHLHPSYQARLADLFTSALKDADDRLRLLVETHSPAIINRVGDLISDGQIPPSAVNIIVFEKSAGQPTSVSTAEFDTQGHLMNWPFGFFEPDLR